MLITLRRMRSSLLETLWMSVNLVSPRARPSAQIQIGHTFKIARQIGLEAAKRKVKAHVRIQHPFYNCKESGNHDEKADVKPEGVVGTWWHEALRALGAIEE